MALIVEIHQLGDKLWAVATQQLAEDENNPDFATLQRATDEGAEEAFRMLEVRDTLRVLLAQTPFERRESEVVALFLLGWDFPEIAQQLGVSRQFVQATFKRAVAKLRKTAKALGISP